MLNRSLLLCGWIEWSLRTLEAWKLRLLHRRRCKLLPLRRMRLRSVLLRRSLLLLGKLLLRYSPIVVGIILRSVTLVCISVAICVALILLLIELNEIGWSDNSNVEKHKPRHPLVLVLRLVSVKLRCKHDGAHGRDATDRMRGLVERRRQPNRFEELIVAVLIFLHLGKCNFESRGRSASLCCPHHRRLDKVADQSLGNLVVFHFPPP